MASHRFTNCYRASDRVSQYLIKNVIYRGSQDPAEVLFRILLFKFFNRISTWELLQAALGDPAWATFRFDRFDRVMHEAIARRERLYSSAYVIPPPPLGARRKHTYHLLLLQKMLRDELHSQLQTSASMAEGVEILREYPGIGDFLAFQLATQNQSSADASLSPSPTKPLLIAQAMAPRKLSWSALAIS